MHTNRRTHDDQQPFLNYFVDGTATAVTIFVTYPTFSRRSEPFEPARKPPLNLHLPTDEESPWHR